jgi:outer membrane protein 40|nr:OmpA family protein [uncultured Porphyromonas sp.]
MKLKFTVLALAGATMLTANAQTEQNSTEVAAHRQAFSHEPGANYFLSLGGGVGAMFLKGNNTPSLFDRLSFTAAVAVGKWHNPYYANRLKIVGGEALTYLGTTPQVRNENYFLGAHYDFMFDVVNYFAPYKENRFFHLIPYVGVGYEYKFNNKINKINDAHALTANAGLQFSFRLARRVNLFLEGEATYNGLNLRNYEANGFSNAFRMSALAGLSFNIGRQGFSVVEPLDQAYIDDLQGQINALRAENAELAKRPEHCPDAEAVAAPVEHVNDRFVADKSILFAQGQATVSKDQHITVFDAAEFVKNGEGEIIVTGYTAKNESRFKGLAEKRARAVAKILTEQYGVASDKITVEWKEAGEAPYSSNQGWNRVVIIRSK